MMSTEERRQFRLFKLAEAKAIALLPGYAVDFYGLQELDGDVYGRSTKGKTVLRWVYKPEGGVWDGFRVHPSMNQHLEVYGGQELPPEIAELLHERDMTAIAARLNFNNALFKALRPEEQDEETD